MIERFVGTTVVAQTFPPLVADAAGNYLVPNGKTLTLDQTMTLTGNLIVNGTLNTNAHPLIVNGTLNTNAHPLIVNGTIAIAAGAGVTNAGGSISYLNRSGAALPGATFLIVNAANDLADPDRDGIVNLLEFKLGLDPSTASLAGLPAVTNVQGHLTLTYSFPTGAGGVAENVEVSADLATWQSGGGFTETMSDTTTAGVRTITVRDVSTTPPRYIRLRVSR